MKKIITHTNPDLDAVAACWILKRLLPGWEEAEVGFATAGHIDQPDKDMQHTLFTDVGEGQLDHHQKNEYTCAAKKCFEYVLTKRAKMPMAKLEQEAFEKIVDYVNEVDNARDMFWAEALDDRYQLYLHQIIDGLRGSSKSDEEITGMGFSLLDATLLNFKTKIRAVEDIEKGLKFESKWGKAVAIQGGNRHVLWHGELMGYVLVVIKDKEKGGVKMYARPDSKVDLTEAYERYKQLDPESDWYLHSTKRLLLNQSSVNPNLRPTKLSLDEVVEVLKK